MGWFKEYKAEDPLRKVANVEEVNRVHRILNDIKGVGCRIEKPQGANGLGWKIVVDGSTDLDPIPDSNIGTDTGQIPVRPYDLPGRYGMPAGIIAMWSGSEGGIPSGWALCDGTSGTPDLRGRFIVGRKSGDTDFSGTPDTGGAKTHTHSDHTVNFPAHSHWIPNSWGQSPTTVTAGGDNIDAPSYSGIPPAVDTGGSGTQTLTHAASKHLPPYYVLAFIMKL